MDKLKVFISGTQADMQPERDAVSRAVEKVALATGIRAEKTLSQPQPPRKWIEEQINDCNIYLGVYSHRYGWVIPRERISATEFEFNLARQLGKPIRVWVRKLRYAEKNLPDFERQQQFLERISDFSEGYMRQEFENPAELENWIAAALSETFIEIIKRETTRPARFHSLPPPSLVDAYLEEVAKQKPYVLWSDESYIDRIVAKPDDLFARAVTRYDPRALERKTQSEPEPLQAALAREGKVILLGEPGMGKTTSLLHLAWEAANRAQVLKGPAKASDIEIPIYVELKNYNGEGEIEMLLARRMNGILRSRNLTVAPEMTESAQILKVWLLESDVRVLLLLDGLNEIRPEFHLAVRDLLRALLNYPHRIVIACRERDYDQSLRDQAAALVLEGLQENEMREYLYRELGDEGAQLFDERISPDDKMRTLATNPLMLWLISVIAREEGQARLPANRGKLFRQFISLMPRLRDSELRATGVPLDVVTTTLAMIGFEMKERSRLTASLGEARGWPIPTAGRQLEEVLIQAKEWRFLKSDGSKGEPVEFLHQLFLEYFAATHLDVRLQPSRNHAETLGARAFDEQWAEVVTMLVGINDQPASLLKWLSAEAVEKKQYGAADLIIHCWETSDSVNDPDALSTVIDAFIDKLRDKDESMRMYALRTLTKTGDPRVVEPIIAALPDSNIDVRQFAAYCLGEIGDPRAIEPLVATLDRVDRLRGVHISLLEYGYMGLPALGAAEDALIKFGPLAVEPLLNALKSEIIDVRETAATCIGKIGDRRAVEPLIVALNDRHVDVRCSAASALGAIGDLRAVEPLITALKDRVGDVRYCAAVALGELGDPRAVKPLTEKLEYEDKHVKTAAKEALIKIGDRAVEELIGLLRDESSRVRKGAASILGKTSDKRTVEPLIIALQDQAADVREMAAHTLGEIGDNRAVEPLITILGGKAKKDKDLRCCAAEALGKIGDARAVRPLIGALNRDQDLRQRAADALGKIGDPTAVKRLATIVRTSKDDFGRGPKNSRWWPEDARRAREALVAIGAPAVGDLIEMLNDDKSDVRSRAIWALARIGHPRALQPLIALLTDQDGEIRVTAASALGQMGDPRALPELERVTREDKSRTIWGSVANAAREAVEKIRERQQKEQQ